MYCVIDGRVLSLAELLLCGMDGSQMNCVLGSRMDGWMDRLMVHGIVRS